LVVCESLNIFRGTCQCTEIKESVDVLPGQLTGDLTQWCSARRTSSGSQHNGYAPVFTTEMFVASDEC